MAEPDKCNRFDSPIIPGSNDQPKWVSRINRLSVISRIAGRTGDVTLAVGWMGTGAALLSGQQELVPSQIALFCSGLGLKFLSYLPKTLAYYHAYDCGFDGNENTRYIKFNPGYHKVQAPLPFGSDAPII